MHPRLVQRRRTSRRRFLFGTGALAAGAAGGALVYRALWGRFPAAAGLRLLTVEETDTLLALAEVYFPDTPDLPSVRTLDVAKNVDGWIASMPGNLGRLTQLLVRAIEWTAVAGTRHVTRFSRLPLEARQQIADAWETSSLYPRRAGFLTLKLAVCQAVMSDPGMRAAVGFYDVCPAIPREEWL